MIEQVQVLIGIGLIRLLGLYLYILIARMIISWIPFIAPTWRPPRVLAVIFELVYSLTDPPIRACRKFIPPLNLGTVSLDLGFMVVFFGVYLLQRVVAIIFF